MVSYHVYLLIEHQAVHLTTCFNYTFPNNLHGFLPCLLTYRAPGRAPDYVF